MVAETTRIQQIDRRLDELRKNTNPNGPFDWDDVEYLRLFAEKLTLGVAARFNAVWFDQMASKLMMTLKAYDDAVRERDALRESNHIFEQNSADATVDAETIKAMVADIEALACTTLGGRVDDHTSEVRTEALCDVIQWASADQMAQRRQAIIRRCHLETSDG